MTTGSDFGLTREIDREVAHQTRQIERMIADHAVACGESLDGGEPAPSPLETPVDRRQFMRGGAAVAGSVAIAGALQTFYARKAHAHGPGDYRRKSDYGEPVPTVDEVTGLALIGLPPGFRYWSFGWAGDEIFARFPGGPVTPALHDGMAVLKQVGPWAILCRNHEAGAGTAYVGGSLNYSPAAAGGNTNLIFDTRRKKWISAWPTLSGTVRNCAGGPTPHETWLSCEETESDTVDAAGNVYPHGWVFEVPAVGASNAQPIKDMGRRSHEAACVDPKTGYVYITEDRAPGGLYRFKPAKTNRGESPYARGGKLEMLAIAGLPNAILTGLMPRFLPHGIAYPAAIGATLDVDWVAIDDPENAGGVVNFDQGYARGGATFQRPEGTWYADGKVYFVCTDGGDTGNGQVFELDPKRQTLKLVYDAPVDANGQPSELDNPDNVVVTPRGSLLFCEDNSGDPSYLLDGVSTERLVGLTPDGHVFTFATNLIDFGDGALGAYTRPSGTTFTGNMRGNEWAGACFDRTGQWLFVNIQTPGVTFAITGPWHHGPF